MVDWNGLYKWSMEHHDGTRQSNFKAMSKEDRDWLEAAMKQYTFNDTDRLTQLVKQLKTWGSTTQADNDENDLDSQSASSGGFPEDDEVVAVLEEMMELAELHARNNLNLCLMGGMNELLSIIFSHGSD